MSQARKIICSPSLYLLILLFPGTISMDVCCQESGGRHPFLMYMTAPTMTFLNEVRTTDLGIGDIAWTMEIGAQTKLYGLIGISGALGYGGVKDNNSFSQSTTWGTLESSFSTLSYDFKAGAWTPLWNLKKGGKLSFTAGLSLGYEGFSGRREIVNCEDCKREKYSFKGGLFAEPEISFFFLQDLLGVGSSFRYFVGDTDLNSSWTILKLMLRFDLLNR